MSRDSSYKIVTKRITKIGDHVLPEPELISEKYMIDGRPVSKEYFEKLTTAGNDPVNNKRGKIMITEKQKNQIVELRAVGTSFQKIATELKISKPTIIQAAKEMEFFIINMRNIEIEALMEKLELTHRHRLETLSKILEKIRTDILSRDLKDIPADKLIELYMKIEVNYSDLLSGLKFYYREKDDFFDDGEFMADRVIKV